MTNFPQKIEGHKGAVFRLKTVCACCTRIVYIKYIWLWDTLSCGIFRNHHREPLFGHGSTFDRTDLWFWVHSHAPSIRSHRGIKVVWPDFQPMRVPEEPVCVHLFRQKPVFTSLQLKSPVHVHRLWARNNHRCDCNSYNIRFMFYFFPFPSFLDAIPIFILICEAVQTPPLKDVDVSSQT